MMRGLSKRSMSVNRMALTTTLLAVSSFPPLVSILFLFYLFLLILRQIVPPNRTMARDPLKRGITKGSKAGPPGFKAAQGT